MEHNILEDLCSKERCVLGISLQSFLSGSAVQKSSLTLVVACVSTPWRKPLLKGELGKPFAQILARRGVWLFSVYDG